MKFKERLTRHQFEKKIHGPWKDDGRRRKNGSFTTWVDNPWKYISDGKSTLRAKSWYEIAGALKLT